MYSFLQNLNNEDQDLVFDNGLAQVEEVAMKPTQILSILCCQYRHFLPDFFSLFRFSSVWIELEKIFIKEIPSSSSPNKLISAIQTYSCFWQIQMFLRRFPLHYRLLESSVCSASRIYIQFLMFRQPQDL